MLDIPRVMVEHDYINANVGATRNLKCHYKASPLGKAEWQRDDVKILPINQKYIITHGKHDKFQEIVLTVQNIEEEDLGAYQCYVVVSLFPYI